MERIQHPRALQLGEIRGTLTRVAIELSADEVMRRYLDNVIDARRA